MNTQSTTPNWIFKFSDNFHIVIPIVFLFFFTKVACLKTQVIQILFGDSGPYDSNTLLCQRAACMVEWLSNQDTLLYTVQRTLIQYNEVQSSIENSYLQIFRSDRAHTAKLYGSQLAKPVCEIKSNGLLKLPILWVPFLIKVEEDPAYGQDSKVPILYHESKSIP